jgi:NitT/TauT family transport system permease protein
VSVVRGRGYPTRGVLRRPAGSPVDAVVWLAAFVLLYGLLRIGHTITAPLRPSSVPAHVSTSLGDLPYYAVRSLVRMFIGLVLSVLFTFVYATAAARLRRAEKILIPILDILQSVPILGFLSITVTAFIRLFPDSQLGLECASIFAVFTSMAWNMTFAFYHFLITQPSDLDEAARVMRLTKWQRFWKLDVPFGMIPLVWNGMMSFGGAWFFLAASETISVLGHTYALPGIGSYAATVIARGDLGGVGVSIGAMLVMVLGVNVVFWRPLVAWSERFRTEDSSASERQRSHVLDLLRRSSVPHLVSRPLRPVGRWLDRALRPFGLAEYPLTVHQRRRRLGDVVFGSAVLVAVAWGIWRALLYVQETAGLASFGHAFLVGLATFGRVVALITISSIIWVPVGVWIGMNPRIARFAQPVVQILASFPANLLFPLAIAVFVAAHVSLNFGGIVLMALGAQWYVLFNVIAGASAIPTDLREAVTSFGVPRRQRWRQLIFPAIFSSYVTGGITASGGAWNAAIVAEVVTYGHHHLVATGLGSYIAQATAAGNFPKILVGVMVMSVYVVGLNRLVWRRLYRLAETRFSF